MLMSSSENGSVYEMCCKVQLFYHKGRRKGKIRRVRACRTAGRHNSPPAKSKPRVSSSHNQVPQDGYGAKSHPHSETCATSKSSTTKTAAPSMRAANTV